MKAKFFIILSVLFFVSCEKEIPLDDEEKAPRIVVNGIFSANDTIRIHVSESRNVLFDGELPNLLTADAKLLDENDNLLGTFVHEGDGIYVLNSVLPIAGNIYKITVSSSGFASVASSTSAPQPLTTAQIDTTRTGDEMNYKLTLQDNGSEVNYYAVAIKKISYYVDGFSGDTIYYEDIYFCSKEIIVQNGSADSEGERCNSIMLFSDATFNGQTVSFSASNYIHQFEDTNYVVATISSVSEDYYKYNVTLTNHGATQGSPFAQPVQVYSNIENGFGIFGGYSSYSDTLIIP